MNTKELKYIIALKLCRGIGLKRAKKLIQIYGSAIQIFKATRKELNLLNIPANSINDILNKTTLYDAEIELNRAQKLNIKTLHLYQDKYPFLLKQSSDAPLVIFYKGSLEFNKPKPKISIVGTRNMTSYGKENTNKIIENIKQYNPIIISGLAIGIDITAHKKALELKLETWSVLAHGLDNIYPKAHRKIAEEILENGGWISEYLTKTPPIRENFLQRNRIIAGLTRGTLVIESAEKGGSLVTASIANSYAREVMALPGCVNLKNSIGCNNLIKRNMAHLINSAEDIADIMNWKEKSSPRIIQTQLLLDLSIEEQIILNLLEIDKQNFQNILEITKLPVSVINQTIFKLEMKNLLKPIPGNFFMLI